MLLPSIFNAPPNITLLQSLARGSLKQNLLRTIRLWVLLRFLYDDENRLQWAQTARYALPAEFTFSDWRNCFFTRSHPSGEEIPSIHDNDCCCNYTTAEWLFDETSDVTEAEWCNTLKHYDAAPDNLRELLRSRLFAVTRRTLNEDWRILFKLGWVQRSGKKYTKVTEFPHHPTAKSDRSENSNRAILQPDLAAIAGNLSQVLDGHQRFFLHVEYIVPNDAIDRVDDWQAILRQVWENAPTTPVRMTHKNGMDGVDRSLIVYPVCVYYVQRAAYLCAWGQVAEDPSISPDWRNYRLDRIHHLEAIDWNHPDVPKSLLQSFRSQQLPTPDHIQECMSEAWGFDFYRPAQLLLLRFDRAFARGYIDNSLRHDTFERVTYNKAKQLVQQLEPAPQRHQLMKVLERRSPDDAYYIVYGRVSDINLMLRLRAWRPKMEVLLPWNLREQVSAEVSLESQLYAEIG
jgi:CRISPR-associated protein (TIGR03985 family)